MLRQSIPVLCICAVIFYSCGSSKKLETANSQIQQLEANNGQLTQKNNELQTQVNDLNARNQAVSADYNKYKSECEKAKGDLQQVDHYLEEQYAMLHEIAKKLEAGMMNFADKGVDVYYRDGLVYVSLPDQLLYKSGSAALGPEAKKALEPLASALNDYPNLKVYVIGNTDDVQFKKGTNDNWSLSTERANGVVRVLRDDYKVDPARLTAAGKGKYAPIADNSTPEGRSKNRRTEIVLNPDLIKVWNSMDH